MNAVFSKLPKLIRRLSGRGPRAADFEPVYSNHPEDAWGYAHRPFEHQRFALIIKALSTLCASRILEVGCAEGHLTRLLAARADDLLACDIVPEAVQRARHNSQDLNNIRFRTLDIRTQWPDETFNLIVYADVLYYFTKKEIRRVIRSTAEHTVPGGSLLFANEWHRHYRWMIHPETIMTMIRRSGLWKTVYTLRWPDTDSNRSITLGRFERL